MLTKQLHLAESQMRRMQSVLIKAEEGLRNKDQEIGRLKRKVKDWETKYRNQELARKKEQQSQANNSEYFYQRCLILENKIVEMEKFLTDYGLIWVGDTKYPANANGASNNYIDACYDQLVANIDQLNLAAGKGEVHVHHNEKGGGAIFKTPSCMAIKFYKNGMTVKGGALRSYDDPTTSSFIRDILDGYFPSELQKEYPDGVPFMVEDCRIELYAGDSFPGQGYRLGKHSPVDNLLSTNLHRSTNILQRSERVILSLKDNTSTSENIPLLPLPTNRYYYILHFYSSFSNSLKPRSSSETSSLDLFSLRSQILASHNNACSSSHLQSHINAELARNSRRKKREVATKNTEYDMLNGQSPKSRDILRLSSSSRTRYNSSTDRSLPRFPPRYQPETIGSRLRPRSRSTSLSGRRPGVQSVLRPKASSTAEINNGEQKKLVNPTAGSSATKHPRGSKSATCASKSTNPLMRDQFGKHVFRFQPPLLHQINEATRKPGELRLKVRSLTGSTVFLVHIFADESVAKLYELLDKAMQTSGHRGYKVVLSGYLPKRLEREDRSLKDNGISRDCVLHLVND
ncbi:uncharacterized protein LOC105275418 [Ooceraea biroi]|uniref:uncharacterized protein LOC105275418 n=1 Tax=Ooceraea biroi TaxID=2015173 RepID=UPI000F0982F1|nr:uncharacterized protein LOC105275418 [Ooceraea biroi]